MPARTFAWAPAPKAESYLVTFFHKGAKVFEARVTRHRLQLPRSFRFALGTYRWRVVPLLDGEHGAAIVDSTFVVSSPSSAR